MSFTYISNIPLASNNPSADQPNMQTNTNSISNLISVDHVGFNTATGGQHKQVTFPAENVPAGPPSGAASVVFTNAGVADSSHPQLFYQNANASFPLSLIKAYVTFAGATGAITASQSLNIVSVTRTSLGHYTIVMNANVVTGTTYGVFGSVTGNLFISTTTISSATTFLIATSSALSDPTSVTVFVTQL